MASTYNTSNIEFVMLAALLDPEREDYRSKALTILKPSYFPDRAGRALFVMVRDHIGRYGMPPTREQLSVQANGDNSIPQSTYEDMLGHLDVLVMKEKNRDANQTTEWLLDHTEEWCQKRAMELAMMAGIEILSGKDKKKHDWNVIPELLTDALKTGFQKQQALGICAADVEAEDTKPLWWPYFFKGKMHVLASQPNRGKGLVLMDIVARIATGGNWPLSQEKAPLGSVIWCETEDGIADTLKPRAIEAGADENRLFFFDKAEDFKRLDLAKTIRDHDIKLIIMSPAVTFLPGMEDMNNETELRDALERLQHAINGTDCAVVFVAHPNKKTNDASIERIMGARAWTGFPRSVVVLDDENVEDNTKRFMHVKWNIGRKGPDLIFKSVSNPQKPRTQFVKIEWSLAESNADSDAAFDRKKKVAPDGKMSARDWLEDYLRGKGEMERGQVIAAGACLGYSMDTLKKAAQREPMVFGYRKDGFPSKSYWFLMSEKQNGVSKGGLNGSAEPASAAHH